MLLDTAFVGRLEPAALTAVGGSTNVVFLMFSIVMAFSTSATALVSRSYGARKQDRLRVANRQCLSVALVTGVVCCALGGAKAMGFDHLVGSIEPGKQADLACIDLSPLESQPMFEVVSQLVYATGRHQVSDVWIAGKPKLRGRELVDMDIDGIIANARQWRERIASVKGGA